MDSIQLSRIRARPLHPRDGADYVYQVDATLFLDLSEAGRLDDATETVDYIQVVNRIVSLVEHEPVVLLEALAARVADAILLSHQVRRTRVRVARLGADDQTETNFRVSVTLERAVDGSDAASTASLVSAQEHEIDSADAEDTVGEVHPTHGSAATHPSVDHDFLRRHREARNRHPMGTIHAGSQEDADTYGDGGRQSVENPGDGSEPSLSTHRVVISMDGAGEDSQQAMYVALASMDGMPGSQVVGISPLYSYRPGPGSNDGAHLCAVAILHTPLAPRDLIGNLRMIESACRTVGKRDPEGDDGPLSLTMVDYGGMMVDDEGLDIPPVRTIGSASVLVPWAFLEPDAVPVGSDDGGSVALLSRRAPDGDRLDLLSENWILDGLS